MIYGIRALYQIEIDLLKSEIYLIFFPVFYVLFTVFQENVT